MNSSDDKNNNKKIIDNTKNVKTDKTLFSDKTRKHDETRVRGRPESTRNVSGANKDSVDKTRFRAPHQDGASENNSEKIKKRHAKYIQPGSVNATETPAGTKNQVLKERFILEKVLGVGGMGVVYKAKDRLKVEAKDRDPYVAIKVLSEEFKTHPEAFIALQRESRKAQRIAHPSTVKVYDFNRDGDVVFMTMEYMVGKPLDQMIKQYQATGLPRNDAWEILSGICSALAHAHSENIVHSDFKSGNVSISDSGVAKIFDFGIARAVANIDRKTGSIQDHTVFDAGSLGALTPAYASLEMLLGKTPDTRDDLYALGCVAYEILTGEHPFNRLPADEAYNKNLKPKRISDISKRQWKAIKGALAFKREDRIDSVDEFYKQLTKRSKPIFMLVASVMFTLAGVTFMTYTHFFENQGSQFSQSDIRNQLEFKIRYKLFKENIEKLLRNPSFSIEWEDNMWSEVKGMSEILSGEPDEWYAASRSDIYRLYVNKIGVVMGQFKYNVASRLIDNAYRYTDDKRLLDDKKIKLTKAIRIKEERVRRLAAEKNRFKEKNANQIADKKKNTNLFNIELSNVNKQLECSSRLNMRDFNIAITKLRSLDRNRYLKLEDILASSLAKCIVSIGKRHPEHALDSKRYALHIFRNNPTLMAIVIKERDACDLSIAGLGARGDRSICRDKLGEIGKGPALVVIPGNGKIKPFAIGKYEVSSKELNIFCKNSKKCNYKIIGDEDLPVTNIKISTAITYLKWLSKKTKKRYRLPTKRELVYAAKSKSYDLDPNRNCQLSTRGFNKGNELVKVNTGKQNGWGLVNYVGNAQEWVFGKGRKLLVVGGSHNTLMDVCTATTVFKHTGSPDKYTGFRVARDLVDI